MLLLGLLVWWIAFSLGCCGLIRFGALCDCLCLRDSGCFISSAGFTVSGGLCVLRECFVNSVVVFI